MQTNLSQIAKAYFGSATFFTIAGEGLMFIAARRHWLENPDYLLPAVGAFSIPAVPFAVHLAARVVRLTRPAHQGPRYFGPPPILAALVPWLAPQPKAPPGTAWGLEDAHQPGYKIKYTEPGRAEFVFYEPGMRSQITESRLYDFCRTAWRRQQNVYFGNLASNKILSREYFTKEARPRFPMPDYQSVIYILDSRGLLTNRYKGGQLLYPAYTTVDEAKRRWVRGP